MKVRLLGTGAADGIPGLYATNPVSQFALEHGGKDIRTRSAALVDGLIKIDLPPDTICQLQRDRLDASDWSALMFTHSHEDHFAVSEIQYGLYPFTEFMQLPFSVYGNPTIASAIALRYPEWPIDVVVFESFRTYTHADYSIIPIPAVHKTDEECHNLLFERRGKTLLYATDTGIWEDRTFDFLATKRLDCLVIECTEGFQRTDYAGHLNLEDLGYVLHRLREEGTLDDSSRVVTTHHAHTGNARHCDLEQALAPLGAEPGYDGMVILV